MSERTIDALAKKVAAKLVVIEIEVELGMRCEDLFACTYEAPGHKHERDLTDRATKMFDALQLDGAFDEDVAAVALVWQLADGI